MRVRRVHIVHGQMLDPSGEIDIEHKVRISAARMGLLSEDVLVLTGGATRKGARAESIVARGWAIRSLGIDPRRILCEDRSRTTGENVMFALDTMRKREVFPDEIVVYHRESAIPKTRVLYESLVENGVPVTYMPCVDIAPLWRRALDRTIFVVLAIVDPKERIPIWKWMKRRFRSG